MSRYGKFIMVNMKHVKQLTIFTVLMVIRLWKMHGKKRIFKKFFFYLSKCVKMIKNEVIFMKKTILNQQFHRHHHWNT